MERVQPRAARRCLRAGTGLPPAARSCEKLCFESKHLRASGVPAEHPELSPLLA